MEVTICYHSLDCLWSSLDRVPGLGKKTYSCSKCTRASLPLEVCAKPGLGRNAAVRGGTQNSVALAIKKGLRVDRNSFLLGAPFTVAVFQIPQRSQIVNGASPLGAGIRLLPFAFASPVGSIVSAMIAGKLKVPPIYLVLIASTLQVIGFTLLSTLPTSGGFLSHAQYGYEVIAGFGVGVNISTLMLMTPFSVEKRDQGT